ncbi:protein-serine,threonine phosphatase [Sarracenia purpurea var. burkii]
MEDMCPAIAVPFVLGNLIYDESILTTHMEITGLELVTSKPCLFSEPNRSNLPLVSTGTTNESDDCNNLEGEASIMNVTSVEEIEEGRENNANMVIEDKTDLERRKDEECRALEGSSETDLPIPMDVKDNIGNITRLENSDLSDTNNISNAEGDLSIALLELPQEKKIQEGSQNVMDSGCVPLWGCRSICGKRSEMEDAAMALPSFLRIPTQMLMGGEVSNGMNQNLSHITAHFFGVYDGHGGCQVANYCHDRIHLALAEEIEIAKEDLHNGSVGNNWQELWKKAFMNCFMKVNAEVGGVRIGDGSLADASEGYLEPVAPDAVGSTAVVAIICPNHLIVANCGDSRAVLCRGKAALHLSVDHKPNREDERTRIEAAGGKVIQWDGFRVSGVLAMSRSIGDRYLDPYVIPEPETMVVPRSREDECLIVASDGLWDVMTNDEVCCVARRRILLWHKRNNNSGGSLPRGDGGGADPAAQDAADYLSRLALRKGSKDNISVIVVDLKAQRNFKKKT